MQRQPIIEIGMEFKNNRTREIAKVKSVRNGICHIETENGQTYDVPATELIQVATLLK